MSWPWKRKMASVTKDEITRRETMLDAVDEAVKVADDARFKAIEHINDNFQRDLNLLKREAELLPSEKDEA